MAVDALPDHTDYLASQVLSEGETVSYRNLSRALKVHVNIAKRMLFDFHQRQNRKKANSVHAIYLLKGKDTPRTTTQTNDDHDGEDTVMQSSPPFSSSAVPRQDDEDAIAEEPVDTIRITLAKENNLEEARASFEELHSIHIYSLSPGAPQDLQVLTDCSRRVAVSSSTEDPLRDWAQYGVIQNEHVKRRTSKRPPPAAVSKPASNPAPPTKPAKPAAPSRKPEKDAPPPLKRSESSEQSRPPSRASNASKSKAPTMKRESSSLMKAFANAPAKKHKTEVKKDDTPALSDEEEDGQEMDLDEGAITKTSQQEKERKTKKDREAELQAMMDAEDEEMSDAEIKPSQPTDESQDPSQDAEAAEAKPENNSQTTNNEEAVTKDGRRRGRRRVMKKRTVQDEEGYLVTKEEAAWESFSEDEPVAKKSIGSKPAAPAKKAAGGKKGQGNIMSFFGKK